jgi:hypothetical protein
MPATNREIEAFSMINDDKLLALAMRAMDALYHRGLARLPPIAPAPLISTTSSASIHSSHINSSSARHVGKC